MADPVAGIGTRRFKKHEQLKRRTHRGRPCHRYSTKLDRPEQHSLFQTFRLFLISRILRLIIRSFSGTGDTAFLKIRSYYISTFKHADIFQRKFILFPSHLVISVRGKDSILFFRDACLYRQNARGLTGSRMYSPNDTHRRNCGFSGSRRPSRESVRPHYARVWPSPSIRYLYVVSSRRAIGPRACNFCVLIPISAPKPNWAPSVKAVETLA